MTHPLTPREKVARLIWERFAPSCDMDEANAMRGEYSEVADAILTALASGSGDHSGGVTDMIDHAELARLAEWRDRLRADAGRAAHFGSPYADKPMQNGRTYWNSDLADDITSLLAEIVALRDRNAAADRIIAQQSACADEQTARATEAERKLAEAVEWRPIETAPRDGTVVLGWSSFFPTRRPLEVSWDDDRYARKPAPRWVACAAAYSRRAFFEHPLTHWLPLPPAPGAEA